MKRRTWMVALAAAATGGATILVACVGDDPVDTTPSGVDGGGTDTATVTDTSTGDTGTPGEDAGGDSAQPSDAGVDSSCANKFPDATFCDDFDNGGYQPDWKQEVSSPGVTIAVVSSPVTSDPFALSAYTVSTLPDGGGASTLLRVERSTVSKNEFKLEADVRQIAATPTYHPTSSPFSMELKIGPLALVSLQIRQSSEIAVCTTPGKVVGADGGFVGGDMPFAYGVWHHVILKIVRNGLSATITCQVDEATETEPQDASSVFAMATASIGLTTMGPQSPINYVFDDVVLDIK